MTRSTEVTPIPKLRPRSEATSMRRVGPWVKARSGGRCEIATEGCAGRASEKHHRKMRSQGGPDTMDNLLHVCDSCHRAAHHSPDRYVHGWLLHSWDVIQPFRSAA